MLPASPEPGPFPRRDVKGSQEEDIVIVTCILQVQMMKDGKIEAFP